MSVHVERTDRDNGQVDRSAVTGWCSVGTLCLAAPTRTRLQYGAGKNNVLQDDARYRALGEEPLIAPHIHGGQAGTVRNWTVS
ncbi:Hypp2535 [Branchiostoma lanceolatum]|uniref:Hypp2535 protein n=1 Tax=Branchiostoma lanceolatum TaxID=7740 RepID=A0A8K0EQG1_BRALA|nr:Hypp2535 [Branchiostoma lanceolatum]